jgi:hypothetical protein
VLGIFANVVKEGFYMAKTEDIVTVTFVNGEVHEVASNNESSELTQEDLAYIRKTGAPILLSTRCEKHSDGKCYYYIGNRKVRCTCPV